MLQVVGESSLGVKIVHSLRANQSISAANELAAAVAAATTNEHQQQEASSILPGRAEASAEISGARTPEAQRACRDPKCSHWNTLLGRAPSIGAFDSSQTYQRANLFVGQLHSEIAAAVDTSSERALNQVDEQRWLKNIAEREALLLKQQKLAVFNQILAHQLMLLSYQQSQLGGYLMSNYNDCSGASDTSSRKQQRPLLTLNYNPITQQTVQVNNFFNQQLPISVSGNISSNANALEKCSSIAYKLMTANSKRYNNARHFNRTFDNSNVQLSGQHQSAAGKSRENLALDERDLAPSSSHDRNGCFSSDNNDNRVIITKYKGKLVDVLGKINV